MAGEDVGRIEIDPSKFKLGNRVISAGTRSILVDGKRSGEWVVDVRESEDSPAVLYGPFNNIKEANAWNSKIFKASKGNNQSQEPIENKESLPLAPIPLPSVIDGELESPIPEANTQEEDMDSLFRRFDRDLSEGNLDEAEKALGVIQSLGATTRGLRKDLSPEFLKADIIAGIDEARGQSAPSFALSKTGVGVGDRRNPEDVEGSRNAKLLAQLLSIDKADQGKEDAKFKRVRAKVKDKQIAKGFEIKINALKAKISMFQQGKGTDTLEKLTDIAINSRADAAKMIELDIQPNKRDAFIKDLEAASLDIKNLAAEQTKRLQNQDLESRGLIGQ